MSEKKICKHCEYMLILDAGVWMHRHTGSKFCFQTLSSNNIIAEPIDSVKNVPISPEAYKKEEAYKLELAQTTIATAQQSDTPQRVYKSCVNCHYDFVCSLNPRNIELPIDARRAKNFFDDPMDVKHQIADIVGKNCKFFMPANPNQTKGNAHEHSRGESEKP